MLNWHFVTSAEYHAAATKSNDSLYFLSDTHEIYRGSTSFTEVVIFIDDTDSTLDAELAKLINPARKKIYMSTTTLEAKIYDGSKWQPMIKPVVDTVSADGTNPISGKAVATYVAAQIEALTDGTGFVKNVSYDKATHALTVSGGEASEDPIVLEGLGVTIEYDKTTGALNLKDAKGAVLGETVNLDLERFVKTASYDAENKKIVLGFNGDDDTDVLEIDVGDLVDTYTAEDTATIALSVVGNKFSGSVKLSKTEGNALQTNEDGLYVAATDLSSCMKLVEDAVAGNIAVLDADGQVVDSGVKAGGDSLAETVNGKTLATELAVNTAIEAAKTALTNIINKKMDKVEDATAGNLPTLTADGNVADSGVKVGGATLAENPDEKTVATEAAVAAAVKDQIKTTDLASTLETEEPSSTTAPSVKAVVDAMTWKTTM